MFTGIITDQGRVRDVVAGGDTRFEIETSYRTDEIALGASIACSGACLTVIETGPDWFAVQASAETLRCTTLAQWRTGTRLNLERALKVGDELGGHIVSGHVDGVGRILSRAPEGDSTRFVISMPADLVRFVAAKGSIAVDGVSLTVNEVDGDRFAVNIIPHTQSWTSFGAAEPGTRVNLEIDMLARYVSRMIAADSHQGPSGSGLE